MANKNALTERESAEEIGKRIAKLRLEKGWTQQELAQRIGASRSSVATWEKGMRRPDLESWFTMSMVFGVSSDYIAGTSLHKVFKGSSISDKLDLGRLNEMGRHMLYEYYHMLLKTSAFCQNTPGEKLHFDEAEG